MLFPYIRPRIISNFDFRINRQDLNLVADPGGRDGILRIREGKANRMTGW